MGDKQGSIPCQLLSRSVIIIGMIKDASKDKKSIVKEEYLNPRWAKFIDEYMLSGNAYKAALKVGFSDEYAKVITSRFPEKVKNSLKDGLSGELLIEKHLALLNKKEKITKNNMTTGEIDVIDTGEVDVQAVKAGLDMAYKLKGSYAPVSTVNLNVDANSLFNDEQKTKARSAVGRVLNRRDSRKG